jgi:hypothetical protein
MYLSTAIKLKQLRHKTKPRSSKKDENTPSWLAGFDLAET